MRFWTYGYWRIFGESIHDESEIEVEAACMHNFLSQQKKVRVQVVIRNSKKTENIEDEDCSLVVDFFMLYFYASKEY